MDQEQQRDLQRIKGRRKADELSRDNQNYDGQKVLGHDIGW